MAELELYGNDNYGNRKDAGKVVIDADLPLLEFKSGSNEISTFKLNNLVQDLAPVRYQVYNPKLVLNGKTGITSDWEMKEGKFYNDDTLWWFKKYKPDSGSWNDNSNNVYRLKWYPDEDTVRSKCCLGKITDPDICGTYIRGSPKCSGYMDAICNAEYGSRDGCIDWCRANPSKCQAVGQPGGYCDGKMNKTECQQYCLSPGANCDTTMINWCRANNTRGTIPICSCIYSFDNLPADKKAFASCFDNECTEYGYKVKSWNQDKGCTNIDCSQVVSADLNNSLFDKNTITQYCGGQINTATGTSSTSSSGPYVPPSSSGSYGPPASSGVELTNVQIMLIVLAFIFLIIVGYMMMSGGSSQQYYQQSQYYPQQQYYQQPQYNYQQRRY